jgi:hypothetical protein
MTEKTISRGTNDKTPTKHKPEVVLPDTSTYEPSHIPVLCKASIYSYENYCSACNHQTSNWKGEKDIL